MNKDIQDNNITSNPHVDDLLPGYIDSSLPEGELDAVRAHLAGCDACRADYDALQATRAMLQQVPVALVPRSFAITEEMVSRMRKPSLLERIFTPRFAPTFAGGSVVAFVLLVFLFASANMPAPANSSGTTALSAQAPESSASYGGALIAPDANVQTKQTNPSAIGTAPVVAGAVPTEGVAGGVSPNSDKVPAPDVSGTFSMTTALAPPEAIDKTPTTELAYSTADTSTEPGMTFYAGNYTTSPPVDFTQVLEAGLLALGIALAAAAVIARRRSS